MNDQLNIYILYVYIYIYVKRSQYTAGTIIQLNGDVWWFFGPLEALEPHNSCWSIVIDWSLPWRNKLMAKWFFELLDVNTANSKSPDAAGLSQCFTKVSRYEIPKSHVRFKDLQLLRELRLSIIPMAQNPAAFISSQWDQQRQTSSTSLWKPHQQRLETRSTRENLWMNKYVTSPWWSSCGNIVPERFQSLNNETPLKKDAIKINTANSAPNTGVQHMSSITWPLSVSRLLLICSRRSFFGCTVVSAENGPRPQVPPDHMGPWGLGQGQGGKSEMSLYLTRALHRTEMPGKLSNRTAAGYQNWNPSKVEVYQVVSHGPQRFHYTSKMLALVRLSEQFTVLLKICDRAQLRLQLTTCNVVQSLSHCYAVN